MAQEGRSGFRDWINEGAGRWITILVCLAVLSGAVAGSIYLVRTQKNPSVESVKAAGRRAKVFCRNCRKGSTTRVAFYADEVAWPAECPLCKQLQAYPGVRCRKCRNITERPQDKMVFRCNLCGGTNDLRGGPASDPMPAPKL